MSSISHPVPQQVSLIWSTPNNVLRSCWFLGAVLAVMARTFNDDDWWIPVFPNTQPTMKMMTMEMMKWWQLPLWNVEETFSCSGREPVMRHMVLMLVEITCRDAGSVQLVRRRQDGCSEGNTWWRIVVVGPTSQSGEVCGGLNIELFGGDLGTNTGKGGFIIWLYRASSDLINCIFQGLSKVILDRRTVKSLGGYDQTPEGGSLLSHVTRTEVPVSKFSLLVVSHVMWSPLTHTIYYLFIKQILASNSKSWKN